MRHFFHAARFIVADFASTLVFVALYALTHSFVLATALAILLGVGQIAWDWRRGRSIDAIQWLSLGLVVVMGGATLVSHD
ncbi:MAG: septation protein IspZ, partial [Pseudomonadota bacterium]